MTDSVAPGIAAVDVAKAFPHRAGLRSLWRGATPENCRWALQGVSFELNSGEALGVVGENGAGKSTLLRLAAGLTKPTSGSMKRFGETAGLLDLSAGLVDQWTGEENARAALLLQGVVADELAERIEQVRRFAELSRHWEEPLRTYSAGMRLRLGYGLAISGAPDLFIADEILAVGDEAFARKCSLHVTEFLAGGGTLLLASHNLYQVEKLCQKAVWLREGRVAAMGSAIDVTRAYREFVESREAAVANQSPAAEMPNGRLRTRSGTDGEGIFFGEPVQLDVDVHGLTAGSFSLEILQSTGQLVSRLPVPGSGRIEIEAETLLPGLYGFYLREEKGTLCSSTEIRIVGERRELGTVLLPHSWGPDGARGPAGSSGL